MPSDDSKAMPDNPPQTPPAPPLRDPDVEPPPGDGGQDDAPQTPPAPPEE
jgi:hypothetical protein